MKRTSQLLLGWALASLSWEVVAALSSGAIKEYCIPGYCWELAAAYGIPFTLFPLALGWRLAARGGEVNPHLLPAALATGGVATLTLAVAQLLVLEGSLYAWVRAAIGSMWLLVLPVPLAVSFVVVGDALRRKASSLGNRAEGPPHNTSQRGAL